MSLQMETLLRILKTCLAKEPIFFSTVILLWRWMWKSIKGWVLVRNPLEHGGCDWRLQATQILGTRRCCHTADSLLQRLSHWDLPLVWDVPPIPRAKMPFYLTWRQPHYLKCPLSIYISWDCSLCWGMAPVFSQSATDISQLHSYTLILLFFICYL